ncbi:hypothetical protein OG792_08675 [Micromonospora sp. NBC_01699]|uniref:hypothetical protein n=1 Tax=Micromonospora sp. NBC_01699 TaxID=2975984 RepID=UPI002E36EC1A|nr:hypothetical protein [Micromonospora sp. NBC_01699]
MTPPETPTASFREWDELGRRLGVAVPVDYRLLVEAYGPGVFDDFLHLLQPKSRFEAIRLVSFAGAYRERLRSQWVSGRSLPYDPDELLPVTKTEDGDIICWVMQPCDVPSVWTLVVNHPGRTEWLSFDGGLLAFLVEVYSRQLRLPFFPDDFPSARPSFQPY